MENEQRRIFMVCLDDETGKDAGEMFKRVAAALSAVDTFGDKLAEIDEDAPDFEEIFAPRLERLIMSLMAIYPDHRQMAADAKSIGDFTVRVWDGDNKTFK